MPTVYYVGLTDEARRATSGLAQHGARRVNSAGVLRPLVFTDGHVTYSEIVDTTRYICEVNGQSYEAVFTCLWDVENGPMFQWTEEEIDNRINGLKARLGC